MSMDETNPPVTPSGRMGDEVEKNLLEQAQQEHVAKEVEEIHAEEATEQAELGHAPATKRPWWKFWG